MALLTIGFWRAHAQPFSRSVKKKRFSPVYTLSPRPSDSTLTQAHQNNGAVQHAKYGAASAGVPRSLFIRTARREVSAGNGARMKSLRPARSCTGGHGAGGGTRGPWPQRGVSSRSSAAVFAAAVAILLGTAPLVRYLTLCYTILELPILKAAHSERTTDIFYPQVILGPRGAGACRHALPYGGKRKISEGCEREIRSRDVLGRLLSRLDLRRKRLRNVRRSVGLPAPVLARAWQLR